MNKRLPAFITFLILALVLLVIKTSTVPNQERQDHASPKQEKIHVTASFYPMFFFAKETGGERVEVTNLTPAGSEPHDYDPSPQDMATIEKSRLLILNGGGVETWEEKIRDNLKGKNTMIIAVGEDSIAMKDPHVWLSPPLAKQEVDKITDGFVKADPANSQLYLRNANNLKDKLEALDQKYKQELKSCKLKDIITAHAAFGYLAASYGFHQVAISGFSPDEEPAPGKLSQVARFAKDKNITYIFFESLVSPKLSETVANEVGARTLVLNPVEGLTAQETKSGKNYFSLMEDNLINLKLALRCL